MQLTPQQDLDDFINEICDVNTTLNEAQQPQGYTELQLVNIALHQLQTSQYADQIKSIMTAYHASSFTFTSLDLVIQALCNWDIFDGKDFSGAPLTAPQSPYHPGSTYHNGSGGGKTSAYGALSAVSDDMADLQLHPKYPWAGQGNLTMQACPLCCTCNHTLQTCPVLGFTYKIEKIDHTHHGKDQVSFTPNTSLGSPHTNVTFSGKQPNSNSGILQKRPIQTDGKLFIYCLSSLP